MRVSDMLLNWTTNLKQTNNTYSEWQELLFSCFCCLLKNSYHLSCFSFPFEENFFNIIQKTRIYNKDSTCNRSGLGLVQPLAKRKKYPKTHSENNITCPIVSKYYTKLFQKWQSLLPLQNWLNLPNSLSSNQQQMKQNKHASHVETA